jgi:hypothetical protein
MMNAASFASGDSSGKSGFFGNTVWSPLAKGTDSANHQVNFHAPVFTEDYKILQDINRVKAHDPLLEVGTLFESAHKFGLKTATVGKSGPAFMQDYLQMSGMDGIVLDERHIYPLAFAKSLQQQNYPLPATSSYGFAAGELTLKPDNGDPTAFGPVQTLRSVQGEEVGSAKQLSYPDLVTPDPEAAITSPYSAANQYLMATYLNKILPMQQPQLSVVWLRNPDTTEHNYGVGSKSFIEALRAQDQLLGQLLTKLHELNLDSSTDIIIVSDHSHSNVSGSFEQFPLRAIANGQVGAKSSRGYSASGEVRTADLLHRAGFNHVYDGLGCKYSPVLSGIKANGELLYPVQIDKTGTICHEQPGKLFTSPSYQMPSVLPNNAIVVDPNGGSEYIFVPSHNPKLVAQLVRFLQSREEFGAIFIDPRYKEIAGTLPQDLVRLKNNNHKNPDIIVGMTYDAKAKIQGYRGIEFSTAGICRGMHGTFGPIDVHNTLVAIGPDFKSHFTDHLPTGNVDVAPTIAYLLGIPLTNTDGRPLLEALLNSGTSPKDYQLKQQQFEPAHPAEQLQFYKAIDPDGNEPERGLSHYTINLHVKELQLGEQSYWYFDEAKALRY